MTNICGFWIKDYFLLRKNCKKQKKEKKRERFYLSGWFTKEMGKSKEISMVQGPFVLIQVICTIFVQFLIEMELEIFLF